MLGRILLGMLVGAAFLSLEAMTEAKAQSARPLVWAHPSTGCIYFVSYTYAGNMVIGSVVLRRDGKPDCPDVDKRKEKE